MEPLSPSPASDLPRLILSAERRTVTDSRTGLVWLPPAGTEPVCFQSASQSCGTGTALARLGWRLPQIGELVDFLIGADADGLGLRPPDPTVVWSASSAPLAEEDALRAALWGPDGVRVVTRTPSETALVWHVCSLEAARPCGTAAWASAPPSTRTTRTPSIARPSTKGEPSS